MRKRHNRGEYDALSTDEIDNEAAVDNSEPIISTNEEQDVEREKLVKTGWRSLGWSFGASGLMTLAAYFFPVIFAIPLFGARLAQDWMWVFSPSLSYVGQGG